MRLTGLPYPTNKQYELRGIPHGVAGVGATLDAMVALARQYKANPSVRYYAVSAASNCPDKAYACEAAAVQQYVRDQIRYVQDVNGIETLQTPDVTLEIGAGDCDDKSLLAASMLESIGHPARFVAVATHIPGEYDHVYVETLIGDKWRGVETTEPVPFGWAPPRVDFPIVRVI